MKSSTNDPPGYDQGTWERIRPEPKWAMGRKDGKAPHEFIDVSALRRLVKILERPVDERLGDGRADVR